MLHEALQAESADYCLDIAKGVRAYLDADIAINNTKKPVIWSEGASQLLDYTTEHTHTRGAILFVPSLINRPYIFDLHKDGSFLEYLQGQNIPGYLMDWGEPGEGEKGADIAHYVERLDRAVDALCNLTGEPVILAGYCMGGMLALASCQRRPEKIAGLALFATPWDFHTEDVIRFDLSDANIQMVEQVIKSQSVIPKEWMQLVFYLLSMQHIHRKYQGISQLDPKSEDAQTLLAIEYWANDGVDVTAGVAKNCLVDWACHNTPLKGKWCVGEVPIMPEAVTCPSFVAIAKHDRIAPYQSALPLAKAIGGSKLVLADTGHVGMVAGKSARKALWEPFVSWVDGV